MNNPIASVAQDGVRAAIRRAADATGVDFSLLVETARRESALNPNARAGTSSATGLFQFIESTWLDMVRRHGGAHGLGEQAAALSSGADAATRRSILDLRNDPELSARMAAELARENADTLQARLGRVPSAGELYAAHVMGSGGALRLIEAEIEQPVAGGASFLRLVCRPAVESERPILIERSVKGDIFIDTVLGPGPVEIFVVGGVKISRGFQGTLYRCL